MPADPKCSAVASGLKNSGLTYAALAKKIGSTEARITDICIGNDKPTDDEFKRLATALGMSDVPHTGAHTTK